MPLFGKLDCIADQVYQDLLDMCWIPKILRVEILWNIGLNFDILFTGSKSDNG